MTLSINELELLLRSAVPTLDVAPVDPDALLVDQGVDSLDFYSFVMQLQSRIGREIPDADLPRLQSLRSVALYCAELL